MLLVVIEFFGFVVTLAEVVFEGLDAGVVGNVLEQLPPVELAGVLALFKGLAAGVVVTVLERLLPVELAGALAMFK